MLGAREGFVAAADLQGAAVVAEEENDRIFGQAFSVQGLEDPADLVVHRCHHGGEGLALAVSLSLRSVGIFPRGCFLSLPGEGACVLIVAVLIEIFPGRLQGAMWSVERQVEEERFSFA